MTDWSWSDPRIWAAAVIIVQFVLWGTDRIFSRKYVPAEAHEALRQHVSEAHHRIDLLAKDVAALPTHSQVSELREDVGQLKQGQARTSATLEGIGREIGHLRGSLDRLDEFMRSAK